MEATVGNGRAMTETDMPVAILTGMALPPSSHWWDPAGPLLEYTVLTGAAGRVRRQHPNSTAVISNPYSVDIRRRTGVTPTPDIALLTGADARNRHN
jgi:hypothetical protein